jgi:hypothetical protein
VETDLLSFIFPVYNQVTGSVGKEGSKKKGGGKGGGGKRVTVEEMRGDLVGLKLQLSTMLHLGGEDWLKGLHSEASA